MLLLTHTWILKEFLGASQLCSEVLDLFAYNASPDLLPIHTQITADITHGVPRSCHIPPEYRKAAFAQFHLLVDDIAHHGRILEKPIRAFNPHSEGYTYIKGRPLMRPIADFHKSIGREINVNDAAYQAHMIFEMAFDLTLYRQMGNGDLIRLFCNALNHTVANSILEFSSSLGWLFSVKEETIREAIDWGKDACTFDRMTHFMNSEDRIGLYIDKFGLDREDKKIWEGVESLMTQGLDLVGDYEDFLPSTMEAIKDSGFTSFLL